MRSSVVLLTHPGYEANLPEIVRGFKAQSDLAEHDVILVLDGGVRLPLDVPSRWKIVRGNWQHPPSARNAGLTHVKTPWVFYLDGDNLFDLEYICRMLQATTSAPADVGVLYTDLRRVKKDGTLHKDIKMPDWTLDIATELSIVDTGSLWRTDALRMAGGWQEGTGMLDDYTTASRMFSYGWKGAKVPNLVNTLTQHESCRSLNVHLIPETLWKTRRTTLLTLFAGRDHVFKPLMDWYSAAELPKKTELLWVDNSNSPEFGALLTRTMAELQDTRKEIVAATLLRDESTLEKDTVLAVHRHVAKLYNLALTRITSPAVVTIEDDVIAPLNGLRDVLAPIAPYSRVAGVSACYPSRGNPLVSVSASNREKWIDMVPMEDVVSHPEPYMPIGMIGGGFTAWHTPLLRKVLPMQPGNDLGWDGSTCAKLNAMGYRVQLASRVVCAHLTA